MKQNTIITISFSLLSTFLLLLGSCATAPLPASQPRDACKPPDGSAAPQPLPPKTVSSPATPTGPRRAPLTVADIDSQIQQSTLWQVHYQMIASAEFPCTLYGAPHLTALDDRNGGACTAHVRWKRGALLNISLSIQGKNGALERIFQFCDGALCYVEQREKPDTAYEGCRYPGAVQTVHQLYVNGNDTLKAVSMDHFDANGNPHIHTVQGDTEVFSRLKQDALAVYQRVTQRMIPTADSAELFTDVSAAAADLKQLVPYVTVAHQKLILGSLADIMGVEAPSSSELASMESELAEGGSMAIIPEAELARHDFFARLPQLAYLRGKPIILYNEKDHSRLVHITHLAVAADLPYGMGADMGASDVLADAYYPYLMAEIEEPLSWSEPWLYGHYAGFPIPQSLDDRSDELGFLDTEFVEAFGVADWEAAGSVYNEWFEGSSPRYDYYFRESSVGDPCDHSEEGFFNTGFAVRFRDRAATQGFADYTDTFSGLQAVTRVPALAVEDPQLQGTIFLFKDRANETPHLFLFRNGTLTPLVHIPSPFSGFSPC